MPKAPDWKKARAMALANLKAMTPEEDTAITAAALADPDALPVDELLRRRGGRPKSGQPKEEDSR